jgi:hypothetical protein
MKKYFNTQVVYNQQPDLIDRDKGIIKGIIVVQLGKAKGHKLFLDVLEIITIES